MKYFNRSIRSEGMAPAAYRNHMYKLSLVSSALSKLCMAGLQGVAIPLAYHALGEHRYELYLLITAALASVAIAQLGVGPGLTQGLAKAHADGDKDKESSLFCSAVRLVFVGAIAGGTLLVALIHFLPVGFFFGYSFVNDRPEIISAANVCVFALMAQIISGVVDSTLAGYQEQIYTNIGSTVANILAAVLLIINCKYAPTINSVILILYGAPTLSRVFNLVILFRRRSYLLEKLIHTGHNSYGMLLNTGFGFWLSQMSSILEQHSGNYILAHVATTRSTDVFATVFRVMSLANSVLALFTQPMWPAFADAIARKETWWVKKTFGRIQRLLMAYSVFLGVIFAVAGSWIFQNVLKIDVHGYKYMFVIIGIYAVANAWTHVYYISMAGLYAIWKSAWVQLCENIIMLVMGIMLVPKYGATGMAMAYLCASLLLPAWLLPIMMKTTLQRSLQAGIGNKAQEV